jgi:hypothetical protein
MHKLMHPMQHTARQWQHVQETRVTRADNLHCPSNLPTGIVEFAVIGFSQLTDVRSVVSWEILITCVRSVLYNKFCRPRCEFEEKQPPYEFDAL